MSSARMEKSMELLAEGALRLALGPFAVQMELEYQRAHAPEAGAWAAPPAGGGPDGGPDGGDRRADGTFAPLPLRGGGGRYRAEAEGVKAALAFGDLRAAGLTALRYRLSFSAPFPTRLRLRCRLPAEVDLTQCASR